MGKQEEYWDRHTWKYVLEEYGQKAKEGKITPEELRKKAEQLERVSRRRMYGKVVTSVAAGLAKAYRQLADMVEEDRYGKGHVPNL